MTQRSLLCFTAFWLLAACASHEEEAPIDRTPHAFDDHECASCGMIVREQPSPRAQAVHRDGERVFFCSLADLIAYQEAPSRHGQLVVTWVEALPVDLDPAADDVAPRPWIEADEAAVVLGVRRERVMGTPALTYASEADARAVAARVGGRTSDWRAAQRALAAGGAE